jgi:D-alanyl-D-alanine carboxypeptidase
MRLISKNIFKPLGLNNSYYGKDLNYLKGLSLPQSYWDVFNNGIAITATPFQQMTVACSKGDDGIVCTTTDAVKYLKGLMEGKLLNEGSMKDLMEFVKDEKGNKRYSMGMIYFDLGGLPAYGHGGGGIGAGCGLLYIPSHKVYVFMATNIGCFIDSKLSAKARKCEMRSSWRCYSNFGNIRILFFFKLSATRNTKPIANQNAAFANCWFELLPVCRHQRTK